MARSACHLHASYDVKTGAGIFDQTYFPANKQSTSWQGTRYSLGSCSVCYHQYTHRATDTEKVDSTHFTRSAPDSASETHGARFDENTNIWQNSFQGLDSASQGTIKEIATRLQVVAQW
jgi:hypothetical protein